MTATITEAELAQAQAVLEREVAQAALERAESLTWPDEAKTVIDIAATGLRDSIWLHGALRAGHADWEAVDPGIAEYAELVRHEIALAKSAEHVDEWAGYLAEVVGKYCGPGAAEFVSGGIE